MIRELRLEDIEKIREIHAQFYRDEFELPDFFNNFLCAFAVTDGDNIVSCGGVRNIAESIVLTNKNYSVRERRTALYKVLDASEYVARVSNHKELHAFVQDTVWYRHLTRIGFAPTKGKPLVLEL